MLLVVKLSKYDERKQLIESINRFVKESLEFTLEYSDVLLSRELYQMFLGWCRVEERMNLSRNCFARELGRVMPFSRVQIKVAGVPMRGYRYVRVLT